MPACSLAALERWWACQMQRATSAAPGRRGAADGAARSLPWQLARRALISRPGAQGDEDEELTKPGQRGIYRDAEWRPGGREELGRRAAAAAATARLQRARSASPESSDAEEQILRMARCCPRPGVPLAGDLVFTLAWNGDAEPFSVQSQCPWLHCTPGVCKRPCTRMQAAQPARRGRAQPQARL